MGHFRSVKEIAYVYNIKSHGNFEDVRDTAIDRSRPSV